MHRIRLERMIYLKHRGDFDARLKREIELPFLPDKDVEVFLDGDVDEPYAIDHPNRIKLVLIRWFGKTDEFTAVANGINVESFFDHDEGERNWHKTIVNHLNNGWEWLQKPEGWRFKDTEE